MELVTKPLIMPVRNMTRDFTSEAR